MTEAQAIPQHPCRGRGGRGDLGGAGMRGLVNLEDLSGPSTFVTACGSSTACARGVMEHTAGGDVTLSGGDPDQHRLVARQ